MNVDGFLDIIIDQAEDKGYPVSWYQAPAGLKDGEWIEHVISQVDKCHSLKVADFDNDGDLDVFAAEMPNSAQVGDIDNDGDIDIIGLRNHNRAPIEMWRNKTGDNKLSMEAPAQLLRNIIDNCFCRI